MNESLNWKCNLDRNKIKGERCILSDEETYTYHDKELCENICEKQVKAGKKIAKWTENKEYQKYIDPNLIIDQDLKIFEKIKEIPLLWDNDAPYNKKIIEQEYLRELYKNLARIGLNNDFINDIINQTNSIKGISMIEENTKSGKNYHYLEDFKINKFLEELKMLKNNSNKNYLVKEMTIRYLKSGHAYLSLCKYDKISKTYQFYGFNPTYVKKDDFLYNIKFFIDNTISKKLEPEGDKIEFINLSAIYGIQNFEILNLLDSLEIFEEYYVYIINNLFEEFTKAFREEYLVADTFGTFKNIKNFKIENLDYIRKEYLSRFMEFYNDIYKNLQNTINDNKIDFKKFYAEIINYLLNSYLLNYSYFGDPEKNYTIYEEDFFIGIEKYKNEIIEKYKDYLSEVEKIKNNILIKNEFDNFSHNCYAWCCYVCILMLINPKIKPEKILKFAFYQEFSHDKIKKIYKNFNTYNQDNLNISINDLICNNKLTYKIYNNAFQDKALKGIKNETIIEHRKILYLKITNIIFIMSKYNYLKDKLYFDYRYLEKDDNYEFYKGHYKDRLDNEGRIQINIDEDTKNYLISTINSLYFRPPYESDTPDKILKSLINGINAKDLINLIIKTNSFDEIDKKYFNYEGKYLKYKQKYLQLKRLYKL